MSVTVEAPAKINLTLDVVGRREDGYHLIESVMQAIDLCDRITVRPIDAPGSAVLTCRDERVPAGPDNTVLRAAGAFFTGCGQPNPGVEIALHKRIPMQAGLAGGSADAAGTLVALDRLFDTRLTAEELCAMAETVGADVPFCVLGGAAFAEGTGTILSPLPSLPDCAIVVVKPAGGVSTAEAYRLVDTAEITRRPRTGTVTDALCDGRLAAAAHELCNVFEEALALPDTAAIERVMREHRTLGCRMTGSGSAVYGLFDDREDAFRCALALRKDYDEVYECRPYPHGPMVK